MRPGLLMMAGSDGCNRKRSDRRRRDRASVDDGRAAL